MQIRPLITGCIRTSLLAAAASAMLIAGSPTSASAAVMAFPEGIGGSAADENGGLVNFNVMFWGPKWSWTSFKGAMAPSGDASQGTFTAQIGKDKVPVTLHVQVEPAGKNKLRFHYDFQADQDTELTLCTVAMNINNRYNDGKAFFTSEGKESPLTLPLARNGIGKKVTQVRLVDPAGKATVIDFSPAVDIPSDRDARIVLAAEKVAGGEKRSLDITVTLPEDVTWYRSGEEVPAPKDWDKWFVWRGTGEIPDDSALNMTSWFDAPAGKYGRITSKGDQLIYNGKPIVLWGANLCYGSATPTAELVDKRVALYASHGINTIRFHKYADGAGGAIISPQSFTEFKPDALDKFDYFISKLKEKGIYVELSPTFGTFKLGSGDKAKVPYFDELAKGMTPNAGAYLATEIGDIQIEQMVNLMQHTNPYTKLTYAEDPAIFAVELLNEQSTLFGSIPALKASPTIRKQASGKFCDWLVKRYGSKEAVLERWGKDGGLNSFAYEGFTNESFDDKSVVPAGGPWYYDPAQLAGSQAAKKARILDTIAFLYEAQNEYYDRYTKALRDAGFKGEIVASNWQAGRAYSHYANLHSDARAGIVDRHNYYGGKLQMINKPGSGLLSTGMQQVADRPFMLSEWIHVFPTQYQAEGAAIICAYGMGLQGWDVSYMFHNGDKGSYDPALGPTWQIMQPQHLGIFPAVARQVLRHDVAQSDVVVNRSVHVPSLFEGKLGFDDQMTQGYDEKTFDSKTVSVSALAAVRATVSFDETFKTTESFNMSPYIREDGAIVSSNKQLVWMPGKKVEEGYFTMDTPATKAVVGFAQGKPQMLGDVSVTVQSPFAAVYLTASEKNADLKTSKRLVLVTMARTYNDGMKYIDGRLLVRGKAPMRLEPVRADIRLQRPGTFQVYVLDQNGARTGKTIPVKNGVFTVDGAETETCYYEVAY